MDRAWKSGANATAPTAPASPSVGYPTEGDPGTGAPATKPGAWWYHMITEELRNVVVAGGMTPSQGVLTQLKSALDALYAPAGTTLTTSSFTGSNRSLAASGYQKLPGGLIIQWGQIASGGSGNSDSVTYPIAFPNAVFSVTATVQHAAAGSTPGLDTIELEDTVSVTGFTHSRRGATSAPSIFASANPAYWMAIGW